MEGLKRKLINYLTRHLIKAVTEDDILMIVSNKWLINKRKLTEEEIGSLKEDAKHFSQSVLWELIKKDIYFLAYLRGSRKAKDANDVIFSNAMFYDISIIESFIQRLTKL